MLFRLILVLSGKLFRFYVLIQTLIKSPTILDIKLQLNKLFLPRRHIFHILALNVAHHRPLKQAGIRAFSRGSFHLLFERIRQNTVKLLYIMLLVKLLRLPSEALEQLAGADGLVFDLHVVEYLL
jgi:hypothetical protein